MKVLIGLIGAVSAAAVLLNAGRPPQNDTKKSIPGFMLNLSSYVDRGTCEWYCPANHWGAVSATHTISVYKTIEEALEYNCRAAAVSIPNWSVVHLDGPSLIKCRKYSISFMTKCCNPRTHTCMIHGVCRDRQCTEPNYIDDDWPI